VPTYEYRCKTCAHTFECFHSMTAKPVRRCPKCGKAVERLIGTGAGIIFKGSGFYCTDYRSDSYRQSAKSDSAPAASTSVSESTSKSEGGGGDGAATKAGSAKTEKAAKTEKTKSKS
jgi:putative FmdB family regulatory protein